MKFKLWLEMTLPSILTKLSSKEEFLSLLKQIKPQEKQFILDWAEEVNKQAYAKKLGTNNPVLLYHGSPQEAIAKNGFQVKKGQRTNNTLMAYTYEVQNQGIFMTDSKEMAHYFGSNRSTGNGNYKIYSAYANLDNLFDVTKSIPLQFRKLGLSLVNSYYGTKKSKLAESDIWWLLDQPQFIEIIKAGGYNAVKFKETINIRKKTSQDAFSYLIFDPAYIVIKSWQNDLIKDIDTTWNYIVSQNKIN